MTGVQTCALPILPLLLPPPLPPTQALVFSQFTTTLDVIQEYLRAYNFSFERIDGGVSGYERAAAITRFNAPESTTDVFLLTTRAGGLGLNLQARPSSSRVLSRPLSRPLSIAPI